MALFSRAVQIIPQPLTRIGPQSEAQPHTNSHAFSGSSVADPLLGPFHKGRRAVSKSLQHQEEVAVGIGAAASSLKAIGVAIGRASPGFAFEVNHFPNWRYGQLRLGGVIIEQAYLRRLAGERRYSLTVVDLAVPRRR